MDSSILNTDRCSSVADQTLETSSKVPNLDTKCYMSESTERKTNLYTKRTASQSRRCFQKMEKRSSPFFAQAIDDYFSETSSSRANVEMAKDDLEFGLKCEYLQSEVTPRKCITPVPAGFIRGIVEQFDNQSRTLDRVQFKPVGKAFREDTQAVTRNRTDGLQSIENTCLAVPRDKLENISQRARSQSDTIAGNSEKQDQLSRSVKPATAPKPKSPLKSKLHVYDDQSEDFELNGSKLTESRLVQNRCMEIANSCNAENMNNSTTDTSSLTNSASLLSYNGENQIPAATCISDCEMQKLTECTRDDDFTSTIAELNTTVAEVDILSGASHLDSDLETDDGEREDAKTSEATRKQVTKKKTRTSHSNSSSSAMKKLVLKESLNQKVTKVPCPLDGPNQTKVIYVNEAESEKDQAPVVVSNSDHLVSDVARGAELNGVHAESMHDSPEAEEPSSAVSDVQLSRTNDSDPLDVQFGDNPSRELTDTDSDEILYEILPVRFNEEYVVNSDYSEPIYEISPILKNSDDSTPQEVQNDTSSVQTQAADLSANIPLVPARSIVHPEVPSPLTSPTPAPRKTSKGHIDVSKLTQVVLPPSLAMNLSRDSSPNPPMTVPRVPPRVGTPTIHVPPTPAPLVLPRKRSVAQAVKTSSRRRPPPMPSALVLESAPPTTVVPALPERGVKHQNSVSAERYVSSRSGGKRPSVGALRGYDVKCVEVDSGNPSKLNSKSVLSAASSRSMNDLLSVNDRGSTLSLHVPAPSEDDSEGDGRPVSPSRSEGYMKQGSDGYLPMGSQRSSTISSQLDAIRFSFLPYLAVWDMSAAVCGFVVAPFFC